MSNDDHEKSNIDAKELSLTRCNACGGIAKNGDGITFIFSFTEKLLSLE
jgi:hypothetical protein